jgi:creatinase
MLHVFQWKNGEKEFSPFTAAEMDRRQNDMRAHLAAKDIDAAIFTSYHGICYYSGFLYCYFGRKYGFVLTQDNATTVSAGIDGGQPWRRSHGDNIIYSDWRRDNFFTALKSLIPAGARRVGIEFDHVSLEFRKLLGDAFPGVEFVDVAEASMWMRTMKSAEEHALIREGTRVCNVGARAVMEAIGEGVPEYEVALASTQAMVREIGKSFPFRRADGHLDLVPVRHHDRWRPQSGHQQEDRARRYPLAQLLPDDLRLLHRHRAHAVLRGGLRCPSRSLGKELRGDESRLRHDGAGQEVL